MAMLLSLPSAPKDWKNFTAGEVFVENSDLDLNAIQEAGRNYFAKTFQNDLDKKKDEEDVELEDTEEVKFIRERLNDPNLDLENYYQLLGFPDESFEITAKDVKENYKHVAFIAHPDKAKMLSVEGRDFAERRYKAVLKAYQTLTDETKRKLFDSSLDFDDAIPSDSVDPKKFYKVFAPVFKRNSRFSMVRPVPMLGDENTPFEEVNAFYNFWYGFKSWREFTHEDEQSVEEGMGRYERRQAENANAKLRQKKKKEETQRMRTLVERAERTDPRIIAIKEAEKAERQKKKDEKKNKLMAAQLEEEAKKKAIEDAKKAEEEAANAVKKAAQTDKKAAARLVKKQRSQFRKNVREIRESGDKASMIAKVATEKEGTSGEFFPDGTTPKLYFRTTNDLLEDVAMEEIAAGGEPGELESLNKVYLEKQGEFVEAYARVYLRINGKAIEDERKEQEKRAERLRKIREEEEAKR